MKIRNGKLKTRGYNEVTLSMEGDRECVSIIKFILFACILGSSSNFLFEDFDIYSSNLINLSVLPSNSDNDEKGKSIRKSTRKILPIVPQKLKDALIGELLGDGSLRLPFSKKGPDGKPLTNANAKYAMTLKSKDHIYYLWGNEGVRKNCRLD